jgi:hypothetical protein
VVSEIEGSAVTGRIDLSEDRGVNNLGSDRSIPMTEQAISPLRRRMIEDMSIRKFAPKTQHDYVQKVKDFAAFLGRSPDTKVGGRAPLSAASGVERC